MSSLDEIYAGFADEKSFNDVEEDEQSEIERNLLFLLPLMIILIVLLLGEYRNEL
jgi:hypothetical protein